MSAMLAQPLCSEVALVIPSEAALLLDAAHTELHRAALLDDDKCKGYFPSFEPGESLNGSRAFARRLPKLTVLGQELSFNFLRLSAKPQPRLQGLHLDTDAATAVTGPNVFAENSPEVWRLLLNLHTEHFRKLCVVTAKPYHVMQYDYNYGYASVASDVPAEDIDTIEIPPRNGPQIFGVLFCSSRVPHCGDDGDVGHFVGGYGLEKTI